MNGRRWEGAEAEWHCLRRQSHCFVGVETGKLVLPLLFDNFNARMFWVHSIQLHRTGTRVEEAQWAVTGKGRNKTMPDFIDVGAVDSTFYSSVHAAKSHTHTPLMTDQ